MNLEVLQSSNYDTMLSLLKEHFPKNERRTDRKQLEVLNNPIFKPYVLKDNDEILAFVSCFDFDDFIFIEHLVVDTIYQGLGIGSKILTLLKEKHDKIVLEVELPGNLQAQKRIKFYEKNGFHYNDITYFIPSFVKDKELLELRIMSYPTHLSIEQFENVKELLYSNVYKNHVM